MTPEPHRPLAGSSVLVVEDHRVLGSSLAAVLTAAGADAETLGELSPHACCDHVDRLLERDGHLLVLLDLDLGPDITGEQLLPHLHRPGTHVLVLTGCEDPVRLSRVLSAGAAAVLHKSEPLAQVITALGALRRGQRAMSADAITRVHLAAHRCDLEQTRREGPFRALTGREREVLHGLMDGRTVPELAALQVVSVETVRTHVKAILAKLGVRSQLAAVARARQAGWDG
jgi:two-component system, NarL family, nitrate/nitrite response regulator NarL